MTNTVFLKEIHHKKNSLSAAGVGRKKTVDVPLWGQGLGGTFREK